MVLPLSVLLASIMTFGSFAENYEFAAMKSSGISLQRSMKMLTLTICLLALVSFFFANNVIPRAQYKFINLRKTIVQQKPAMAITEGQFNTIGNFNIKVDQKTGDNGEFLEGVIMHIKNNKAGLAANTVIKAKNGILRSNENSNYLQLELLDGNYYENIIQDSYETRQKKPFAKSSFNRYIVNIDLTKLNTTENTDEDITSEKMLTINELNYTIDSLKTNYNKDVVSFAENIASRNEVFKKSKNDSVTKPKTFDLLSIFSDSEKSKLLEIAKNNLANTEFTILNAQNDLTYKKKNINSHWIVYYEKFMIAYSCLLMFFIGAPLGAIIRKGGVGLPMVFAVIIFITFHFINTFGRKLAQEDGIHPFLGVWMASLLLTPFAIMLTYRATNDIGIMINFDWITEPIMKLFNKKEVKDLEFKKEIVSLNSITLDLNNKVVSEFSNLETNVLVNIVKNAEQFNYDSQQRLIALKILESRGISQQNLLEKNELYNKEYLKLKHLVEQYNSLSNWSLVFYLLAFILNGLAFTNNIILILIGLINLVIMYIFIYKSIQNLEEIEEITGRKNFTNIYMAIIFGFPFLLFIYFFNKSQLKEALKEYNS